MPTEQVDSGQCEHKTPEYTAINPLQRMPALVLDDGTVITESIAICRYFEALQPEPPLFGTRRQGDRAWSKCGTGAVEINFCRRVARSSAICIRR